MNDDAITGTKINFQASFTCYQTFSIFDYVLCVSLCSFSTRVLRRTACRSWCSTASESAQPQCLWQPISPSSRSASDLHQSGFCSSLLRPSDHSKAPRLQLTRGAKSCDQHLPDRSARPTCVLRHQLPDDACPRVSQSMGRRSMRGASCGKARSSRSMATRQRRWMGQSQAIGLCRSRDTESL